MKTISELTGLSVAEVELRIEAQIQDVERMTKLQNIYTATIPEKEEAKGYLKPNFKYYGNHAKYITTIINSYFISKPPKYSYESETIDAEKEGTTSLIKSAVNKVFKGAQTNNEEECIAMISDWYKKRHIGDHDFQMGKYMSVMGRANELMYIDKGAEGIVVKLKALDPRQTMLFRLNDIEETVVGAMHYVNDVNGNFIIYFYTDTTVYRWTAKGLKDENYSYLGHEEHYFGSIPVIEYYNNDETQGDFEQVVSQIDAYNRIMSDRVNDKEQLADAIMVVTGGTLPDKWKENLKKDKLLHLPTDGSTAEWLIKNFDESQVEVLRKAIKDDIHQFSFVPNLTDENFAGNASGVALSYKLIGMELLINEKETHFSKGLRLRLKRLFHVWSISGNPEFDYESIEIQYTHSLPTGYNLMELVNNVRGLVSDETLLSQLPFVTNVQEEIKRVEEEKKALRTANQEEFAMGGYASVFQNKDVIDNDAEGQEE